MRDGAEVGVAESLISSTEALDAAFAGQPCDVVRADGTCRTMATHRWTGRASVTDMTLFVAPCTGPTLDVGCGPGRISEALQEHGVEVLGLDISAEAVRQTRRRGVRAIHMDFFSDFDDEPLLARRWAYIVLADGNIGLGGDPTFLLRRTADLLEPGGSMLVEVAGPGATAVHEDVHLRVGDRESTSFVWATVGCDVIGEMAASVGLALTDLRSAQGRYVATLQHQFGALGLR